MALPPPSCRPRPPCASPRPIERRRVKGFGLPVLVFGAVDGGRPARSTRLLSHALFLLSMPFSITMQGWSGAGAWPRMCSCIGRHLSKRRTADKPDGANNHIIVPAYSRASPTCATWCTCRKTAMLADCFAFKKCHAPWQIGL